MQERELQHVTERLSALIYLNGFETGPLYKSLIKLRKNIFAAKTVAEMTADEWSTVIDSTLADDYIRNLQIREVEKLGSGHKAILLSENINYGRNYVVFRGTGGPQEWRDNAIGMFDTDTTAQRLALGFAEKWRHVGRLIACGHSKGGNKAQYTALMLPYIEQAYSFDGQGFSPSFVKKYSKEIAERKGVINLLSERRSFVHALGIPIGDTLYFEGRRGQIRIGRPHGDPLPYFHCPDALRLADGSFGNSCTAVIPSVIFRLSEEFIKRDTKREAINLLKPAPAAIVQVILIFMELLSLDESFRKAVKDVMLKETDVLLASLDASYGTAGRLSGLGKKVAVHLGLRLAVDRKARLNFVESLRFIGALRLNTRLRTYIAEGMKISVEHYTVRQL